MIKSYENKLLNQLLQGRELIIKRNGYCYSIWYNKNERHLHIKRDDESTCYNIYETTIEELVDFIKRFFDIKYKIYLSYDKKEWYLQKDGIWADKWHESDYYYKKPNVEYIIDKAINFIKTWNIKLYKRKTISLKFDNYNIKLNNLL